MDRLIVGFDTLLRGVTATPTRPPGPNPAAGVEDGTLDGAGRRLSAGLMRVNHTGEVCAQALYSGQGLTARSEAVRRVLRTAADEEADHLHWCAERVAELGGRTSLLNPLWYIGAFGIGAVAGAAGDKYNLGFVAETERQVEAHLDGHLERLPREDRRSRAIVERMKQDEARHGGAARAGGGVDLPKVVRMLMRAQARVMTTLAMRI
ncbi:MAG: 2-polyprenyl-3-methyl-6-methoxy-1,4-benzoquinone monooxygenase [Gammaproteobacteria bacterium]